MFLRQLKDKFTLSFSTPTQQEPALNNLVHDYDTSSLLNLKELKMKLMNLEFSSIHT